MVKAVNTRPPGMSSYTEQIKRQAWREEMLSQVLSKVREVAPTLNVPRLESAKGPPRKGSLVDIFA